MLKDQLYLIQGDLIGLIPVIILIIGSVLLLIFGVFYPEKFNILKGFYAAIILTAFYFVSGSEDVRFGGMITFSYLGNVLHVIFLISSLLLLIFTAKKRQKTEFYFLVLALLVGAYLLVISRHLLLIYMALELISYSSYFLTAFSFNHKSSEASLKYALFGGVSSAIMLFGISLVFMESPSLFIADITYTITSATGLLLVFSGLLFKSSLVPFHLWVPNTYERAPVSIAAYLSVVSKLAGMAVIYFLINGVNFDPILLVRCCLLASIASIVLGTLGAINQTNVRRLVAYGAIAHSGFLMPFLLIPDDRALQGFIFYAIIYTLMNFGVFYFISVFEKHKIISIRHYAAMAKQFPAITIAGFVMFIALVGLPPTAGFMAKLSLFGNVWNEYAVNESSLWLAYFVLGILSTAVSLYFYLRVPFYAFLSPRKPISIKINVYETVIATFFALLLFIFFIQPEFIDIFVSSFP